MEKKAARRIYFTADATFAIARLPVWPLLASLSRR